MIVGTEMQESFLFCKAIIGEDLNQMVLKLQNRLAGEDHNLMFNKYCTGHYFSKYYTFKRK